MSGHSKWATTKHKKAAIDAKRAKAFAKYIKGIEVAARMGGADTAGNPALDLAVSKAKKNSVPNDNIDRAIKRGAGLTGETIDYSEILYEARGPQGTALYIECLTDNKNRAASEVRVAVTRHGGTMADSGSVAYLFERKGVAEVTKTDGLTEDDVLMAVLDAGADEVIEESEVFEVVSEATDLPEIRKALEESGLDYNNDDPQFRPTMKVDLDAEGAKKFLKLADAVEELDDVQNVYSNANIPESVLAELEDED
ncbi:YebC/PmpR family DNA-binding transcriptional regulator [Kocuria sp. WRN011]|uniref:Probable transcriptional regulatory protein VVR66_00405 n=1 Tax=Kocuria carniphila TaxID=262208 RepID=A0ABV3UYG7_9MICC|nr:MULTISPECIES: YebC/PmpR family DNA-binding transcriptional regulator [Kocuria]MCT1801493.1 YebC/PmpR family DNA-binding transcriptional regulator [Kocuria carniphila]PBB08216.1 YebC/PmpR family DNA-binding transcriptional regulator [Kocuria sp. WRN011]PZP31100.1 MAG: YebC/PmpR family DNA-binding transcriptional regulator [Kocuria rhizophila]